MTAFSVVIPTHQRRAMVLAAIESVLEQDMHDGETEIIVVDDGSTDGTAEAIRSRHGRGVTLARQPNRGPAAARNAAVRIASGETVAFLDSDDRWRPHHLQKLALLRTTHPRAVLVGTAGRPATGGGNASGVSLRHLARDLLVDCARVGPPSTVGIRRDAFDAAGGFDERLWYGEDDDLYLRLGALGPFALVAADTVERGKTRDSLQVRGRESGGYGPYGLTSAENLISLLDQLAVVDGRRLRAGASARRSMALAAHALATGAGAGVVREHVSTAIEQEPSIGGRSEWLVAQAARFAAWHEPEQRLRMLRSAATAWPDDGSGERTQLRARVLREALRQRRWADVARESPSLLPALARAVRGAAGRAEGAWRAPRGRRASFPDP